MAVQIKTYNEILGAMARRIIADTPVNDLHTGSVILTLLEAVATNDFENNTAILSVLELLNIDTLKNNDLDSRAADFGLERRAAVKASGFVTISDSNIEKQTTGLYPVKPAPISGSTKIFVNNASSFSLTGNIYIGRGTPNFEGPISYNNVINNGSFYTIELDSALQNDHLISDVVIDAQGTIDRLINAGTIVKIPSNNQQPEILYKTLRDAVIPAGESFISAVSVVAIRAGTVANAGINTITSFDTPPFIGAIVANTSAFNDGRDIESDEQLRERIKSFADTLARGTRKAILTSIIGVSDADDNKQVASAKITEPVQIGDPSIIYIDDGTGFQPSFEGQSVDGLLKDASGSEEFLQLANYPLPRPQIINTVAGPFELFDENLLRLTIDNVEEQIAIPGSIFSNSSSVTMPELIVAINDRSTTFKARLSDNSTRIVLYTEAHDAETIQILPISINSLNDVIKWPTNEFSYISLYQNSSLLREKQRSATVTTNAFDTWNITDPGALTLTVDGTPAQTRTFDTSDFGGVPLSILALADWVQAFNSKFAGVTASATSANTMEVVSNNIGSLSSIVIVSGSYFEKWFSGQEVESTGQDSNFKINRQNGNIQIINDIEPGDTITAGTADAKGNAVSLSASAGLYNVGLDADGKSASIVMIADSTYTIKKSITAPSSSGIVITDEGNDTMRITADLEVVFRNIQPLDYIYITNRGDADGTGTGPWVDLKSSGLYQVVRKGSHIDEGTDTFVEVKNLGIVPGVYAFQGNDDIKAFSTDGFCQIWSGDLVAAPAAETIANIVNSINDNMIGMKASIFRTNFVKLTSRTEEGGSIAIPVVVGNGSSLFTEADASFGNASHIANKISDRDLIGYFRRTPPVYTNIWLDRFVYTGLSGRLSSSVASGDPLLTVYGEILTDGPQFGSSTYNDTAAWISGPNKGQDKPIRRVFASGDTLGTQQQLPNSIFDNITNDELAIFKGLSIAPDDSVVFIMDQDPVAKTIDVRMSRTGRVNNGSGVSTFLPTSNSLSADDEDNEDGVDFGNLLAWGTSLNKTDFSDYSILFKARNWYATGGAQSGLASMMVRSQEWGPVGERFRFRTEYPSASDQPSQVTQVNSPDNTLLTYFFGSGPDKSISMTPGTEFVVTAQGSGIFRYTFITLIPPVNLTSMIIGDIVSIGEDVGINSANQGVHRVTAVNSASMWFEVYNPTGQAQTIAGAAEETDITTVADVIGSANQYDITALADIAGDLDQAYFLIEDENGSVAVWYDLDNAGNPMPAGAATADRAIKIAGVDTGDIASDVASKTASVLNPETEFVSFSAGDVITITNTVNGPRTAADISNIKFVTSNQVLGVADLSLDGEYFTIYDQNGSVVFWYDVSGVTPAPIVPGDRFIQISTVNAGDDANTVASKTQAYVNADIEFSATVLTNVISVIDSTLGSRSDAVDGDTGFTIVVTTQGENAGTETVVNANLFKVYTLTDISIDSIVSSINESNIFTAAVINTGDIDKATRDEVYTPTAPGDYHNSLSYNHDPDPISGLNGYASMYDSETWISDFQNTNPNFTLKRPLLLVDAVDTSIYRMDTTLNADGEQGEEFKLLPKTLENVYHQFTQKALSQMPIVSDVELADRIKNVQFKSKQLGSSGAVEVVGGRGNIAKYYIFGDSQESIVGSDEYLTMKVPAFPVSLSPGDSVRLENDSGVERQSRLIDSDTISVSKSGNNVQYQYNAKDTRLSQYVRFKIEDVSSSHGRDAGAVWRWTHNDGGSRIKITGNQTDSAPLATPQEYTSGGVSPTNRLHVSTINAGAIGTAQDIDLTVSTLPTQGDYFYFTDQAPVPETYAVWFDVDANGTAPTAGPYIGADHQIEVNIATGDTETQILSKVSIELTALSSQFGPGPLEPLGNQQFQGANFDDVLAGDLLMAYSSTGPMSGWDNGNLAQESGVDLVSGFPIIAVDSVNRWIELSNPNGLEMLSETEISALGTIKVVPTPIIEWKTSHCASTDVSQVTITGGVAVASTTSAHGLNVGDQFELLDNIALPNDTGYGVRLISKPSGVISILADYISNGTGGSPNLATELTNNGTSEAAKFRLRVDALPTQADYFVFESPNSDTYAVWFDVDANGTAPTGATYTGATYQVEVNILSGDTVTQINDKLLLALSSDLNVTSSFVTDGTYVGTVTAINSSNVFSYATSIGDGAYSGGQIIKDDCSATRYRVEKFGYNNLMRITAIGGSSPRFVDNGVAVDDVVLLSGDTFVSSNNGEYRILGLDNNHILIENANGTEESTFIRGFNNTDLTVLWTAASDEISGTAGSFKNIRVGDWVKKKEDSDSLYLQVLGFDNPDSRLATVVTLGSDYTGSTGSEAGVTYNQNDDVFGGVELKSTSDIRFFEADAVRNGDSIYIETVINDDWFTPNNSEGFTIDNIGITTDFRPYVQVNNINGSTQAEVDLSIKLDAFKIIESDDNKFSTIREVTHISIDSFDDQKRVIYMTPSNRSRKFSESNRSNIQSISKMGYPLEVTTGIDGYNYYTGLLRTTQRIVDGYEPDAETYPGQKAVGSIIEILPPLIQRVTINIDVTTNEGVNLNDITNEIKSVILNYVNTLDVGEDVILSDIVVGAKSIVGVEAVTFVNPEPSEERIVIADNEKAFLAAQDIGIS